MKCTAILILLVIVPAALADNQEKAEKKVLQERASELLKEAKDLEKSGELVEARTHYANSQAFWETKDAAQAIKHIDEEIHKRVKDALKRSHQLYDKGEFKQAAEALENVSKLGQSTATLSYDLALCYYRIGDSATALAYLDQATVAAPDPKRSLKLKQMRAALVTSEQAPTLKDADRVRIDKVNQLIENVGFEASLEEGQPSLQVESESKSQSGSQGQSDAKAQSEKPGATGAVPSLSVKPATRASGPAGAARRNSSLCQALKDLGDAVRGSPSFTFDLANCAQDNDRPDQAASLLARYLELAPNAADADLVRLRIADLKALAALPDQKGTQVRSLYSSASRSLQERKYDLALAAFQKAATVDPAFAPTQWRLALLYEALGNADQARQYFTRFRELETNPAAGEEAGLHLETLDVKRETYEHEAGAAQDIVSDLLNRAMNLTFNGMQDRAALRKQRAQPQDKKKSRGGGFFGGFGGKPQPVTGGFSVPYP